MAGTEGAAQEQPAAKVALDSVEDDDEFEEFECEDWGKADEAKGETKMWEDDWDDAGTKDDFSQQLRAALKAGTK
eukprot:PRCOL_00000142-RA